MTTVRTLKPSQHRCTYRRNGDARLQCSLPATAGWTTCGRHHSAGRAIVKLPSRKRSAVTGYRAAQRATRPPSALGASFARPNAVRSPADRTLTAARATVLA